jgi:hypothetical protein
MAALMMSLEKVRPSSHCRIVCLAGTLSVLRAPQLTDVAPGSPIHLCRWSYHP